MGGAFAPLSLTLASGRRTLPTQSAKTPRSPLPVNGALLLSRAHGAVQGMRHNDAVTPARVAGAGAGTIRARHHAYGVTG